MDSDLHQHHHHQHLNFHNHQLQSQQQNTMNSNNSSGLTRYRSAPSSYFADLISSGIYGDDDNDPFFNPVSRVSNNQQSSDDFLNQISGGGGGFDDHNNQSHNQFIAAAAAAADSSSVVKQEQEVIYSESQQQQHFVYQNQNQFQSETTTDHNIQQPSSTVDNSTIPGNLLRQSSSPAGFFAHLDIDNNGYSVMRSMDDYRATGRGNVSNPLLSSTKRMKKEMGFSSGSLSSSGTLPRINEGKVMEMKSTRDDGGFGSHSWDDSDILSDSFLKELGVVEGGQNKLSSLINPSENQNDVGRIRAPTTLVHHLSLPASTAELDKLLQFQDSVPLRSRAKRGCATHPRSIAERVRRTRISERMRKLQDLVPNMDKQTNTADMLDLAVDYIKELQKEAETLTDHHAKCTCPHKQKLATQV
uniref:transcription factor bHLH130-like isoform X2 n=1 Tax=Erigeron canadensis TaxID=72917 RepID=UPI001CB93E0C|nr:transcription factor bHLH130-like isoform X2 [Erigeron canadensis]